MLLICSLHFIWASNAPSLKHHWPLTRCLSRFFFSRWEPSTSWPWARPLRHEHALLVTTIYTIIRRRAVAGSINQSTSDHEIFDQKAYWTRASFHPTSSCLGEGLLRLSRVNNSTSKHYWSKVALPNQKSKSGARRNIFDLWFRDVAEVL